MTWNHSKSGKTFGRKTCPICGSRFIGGSPDGSFDNTKVCSQDETHYRHYFSTFCDSITILEMNFDGEDGIEQINLYLNEVGNVEHR